MYDMIQSFYAMGIYAQDDLKIFVQVSFITSAQFKEITGADYTI